MTACPCGAHSQHRVFAYLMANPGVSLKIAAKELGMTHLAVRLASHRLKQRNTSRLCPSCFEEALEGLTCRNCGAALDSEPVLSEVYDSQTAVYVIQPLGGLGSVTNYSALHLQYGALNIKHEVEKPTDPLLERAKSLLWAELKGPMFDDRVVEESTRLLAREVSLFRAKFPNLVRSKGLAQQLVENIVTLLKVRYPNRFPRQVLEVETT